MKKYIVTAHAKQRAAERLDVPESHAENHVNQLMQTAYYVGSTPGKNGKLAKVFDHYKSQTRIIVGTDEKVITVYKFPQINTALELPQVFADDIRQLIQRKLNAKKRDFKRKQRALEIEHAEHNLELAQLTLNQAKAKSPKTRSSLAEKISEIKTKLERVDFELKTLTQDFETFTQGAEAYL